jgi:ribosome-binding protein aMBF1 (putative translation factor)
MKRAKRKRLEATGWKVGSANDFPGLTPEEAAFVELKLTSLKERRQRHGLSQSDLAKRLRSSQSRVAKMEGHSQSDCEK